MSVTGRLFVGAIIVITACTLFAMGYAEGYQDAQMRDSIEASFPPVRSTP